VRPDGGGDDTKSGFEPDEMLRPRFADPWRRR